jgi:FkbM family methyltransferase
MRIHSPAEERALEKRLTWIRRITRLSKHVAKRRISRLCNRIFYLNEDKPDSSLKFITRYHRGLLLHVDTNSWLERWILNQDYYEPELVQFLEHALRPGMVAFDVGANIGCHTLVMAQAVGPSGKVFSFEPHPAIHRRLESNVCLNRLANVELLPISLSDRPGRQTLFAPLDQEYNQGLASMHRSNLGQRCQEITITSSTVDDFVFDRNLQRLDLLKIDVEGHEFQVLTGAREVLRKLRPTLVLEFSERQWANAGSQPEQVEEFLAQLGYNLFVIRDSFISSIEHGVSEECNLLAVPQPQPHAKAGEIPAIRRPILAV